MKSVMRAGILAVLVSLVAACGVNLPKARNQAVACHGDTYDFRAAQSTQPLGSSTLLYQKMIEARDARSTIGLLDLTRSAGWSDEWDRVVNVWENTTGDELNAVAGTPGYCWKGIPGRGMVDDNAPDGYYLFIRGGKPVQFVQWRPSTVPIHVQPKVVMTKETVLVMNGAKLWPQ